jgi:hypothetical protein
MADPFIIAGGALSLINTLVKIHQEHARDPAHAPGMADIMKTIPGAAFEASGRIIAEVEKLQHDCDKAGIDPKQTLDELKSHKGWWFGKRRRVLDNFKIRVTAIGNEVAVLFDDVVAISNCSESEELIASGYRQALESKRVLEKDIADSRPVGEILENLRRHAQNIRAEIGDLGKKKK